MISAKDLRDVFEDIRSEAGKGLAYLTDETLRLEVFDQWVEILYDLPDWVIPYP